MGDLSGPVLLASSINVYDAKTRHGRRAQRISIVAEDHGCRFTDGSTTELWGLPDSPRMGRPTLAAVVRAETYVRTEGYVRFPETYLLLVADDGTRLATLAHVTSGMAGLTEEDLARIWPPEVFAPLAARGVPLHVEQTHDIDELERRYPGTVPSLDRWTASSRAWLVLYVLIGLMTALAFFVAWRSTG